MENVSNDEKYWEKQINRQETNCELHNPWLPWLHDPKINVLNCWMFRTMLTSTGWWPREAGRWQHTGRWWLLKMLLRSRVHQRTRCQGGSGPRSAAPWTWAGSSWSTSGSSSITSRTTWWWWAADIRRWEAESGTRRTQDAVKPTGTRSQLLIFCKQKSFQC